MMLMAAAIITEEIRCNPLVERRSSARDRPPTIVTLLRIAMTASSRNCRGVTPWIASRRYGDQRG